MYGERVGLVPWHELFAIVDTHEGPKRPGEKRMGWQLAELLAPAYQQMMEAHATR